MSAVQRAIWQPFVRTSIAIGIIAGFGSGTLLFTSLVFGFATGRWWLATAQAHGHAQLFGWAGLMVLGVGLHFLPRLASAPEVAANRARLGFWFLFGGLVVRIVSRPLMAVSDPDWLPQISEFTWTLGVAGELIGAGALVAALWRSIATSESARSSAAVRSLLPLLIVSFGSLLAVLATTLTLSLYRMPGADLPLDQTNTDNLILLTFHGFLIPISVAMSARLFPLYVRTQAVYPKALQTGLILLITGTVFRLANEQWEFDLLDHLGRALLMIALVTFVIGIRIFGPRRPLPRKPIRVWQDAPGLHALTAYIWLLAAGIVQLVGDRWTDVEIHLLGMGFVTLLILGMGVHLLPGFARRTMRHPNYVWSTLVLGNLAVVCRVIPSVPDLSLSSPGEHVIGSAAGVAGLLALILFALNVRGALVGENGDSSR